MTYEDKLLKIEYNFDLSKMGDEEALRRFENNPNRRLYISEPRL